MVKSFSMIFRILKRLEIKLRKIKTFLMLLLTGDFEFKIYNLNFKINVYRSYFDFITVFINPKFIT